MQVRPGPGKTEYGPGVDIILTGDEVARAVLAYLVARGVHIEGARTIMVNDELCDRGRVYVDPSGFVISEGDRISGRDGEWDSTKVADWLSATNKCADMFTPHI